MERGSLLPGIFWMVCSVPGSPGTSENESAQEEEAQQEQGPPESPPQWWQFTVNPFGQWCPHEHSVTVTENSYAQDCYSFLSTENHLEIKRQTQDTGHKIERLHILLMNLSQTPGECLPRGVLHTESKGNHEVMSFPYMELIT